MALAVRDHHVVGVFSLASVGFTFLFAAVVIIFALAPTHALAHRNSLQSWEMDGLLVSFPVMAYGFTAHPYYLGIFAMMPKRDVKQMSRVTDLAMGMCAALYWVVGLAGYLCFGQRTAGDLLRNFGGSHSLGAWPHVPGTAGSGCLHVCSSCAARESAAM
jgi:amino acid permease